MRFFGLVRYNTPVPMTAAKKTTSVNMTEGSILKQIVLFSLPLMLGNVFQMLYNTVDMIVVGNFVGKEALAAVGSTSMVTNMAVFFFNGFSVGASVVIARHFGAGNQKRLHTAIETTMTMTFAISVLFTILGVLGVRTMLGIMDTPADVIPDGSTYLRIYFWGIAGLLVYNMGSGILRSVGDTRRPLYFLVLTSILNIVLDLVFVLVFHGGIAGAAYATILSQFVSAGLVLILLSRTNDIYKLTWNDLGIDLEILCWSTYNKLDQFVMLPMQSIALAATTFVSQNLGAGKNDRTEEGTRITVLLTVLITAGMALVLFLFAPGAIQLFSREPRVVDYGVLFLRTNVFFLIANAINHVLAASLRGRGDSRAPMRIMLFSFVLVRQVYLFLMTHFIINTPRVVGFGYPVGWVTCCIIEVSYYYRRWKTNYSD